MSNELDPASSECPVCSGTDLQKFKTIAHDSKSTAYVDVVECNTCSFAWQYPLGRTEDESIEHFDFNYQSDGVGTSDYFNSERKKQIVSLELDFVSNIPFDGNRLLDFGAGAGFFAKHALENGYEVTAIDPTLDVQGLGSHQNLKAIRGGIDSLDSDQKFDVITMWDVIEHLPSPFIVIEELCKHLEEGGWLVIETGNYKSLDRLNGGNKHWIYQLDHRWYFSPESVAHFLGDLGFSELIHSDKTLRPGWSGTAHYSGPSRLHLLKSIAKSPTSMVPLIKMHRKLLEASKWRNSGIGIFTLAARK